MKTTARLFLERCVVGLFKEKVRDAKEKYVLWFPSVSPI